MAVALGAPELRLPEHLVGEIETISARLGDRGEAVPKVMNAEIVEPGSRSDALPGLLDVDEMSVATLGRQNIGAAFLAQKRGERA
jgi:hypothetical protein